MKHKLRVEKLEGHLSHQPVEFTEKEIQFIGANISKKPNRILAVIEKKIRLLRFMKDQKKQRVKVFRAFFDLLSERTVLAIKAEVYKKLSEKEPQHQNSLKQAVL